MYDKLTDLINSPATNEDFLTLTDFFLALPKSHFAKVGDIRGDFDSVSISDLKALRKNLCKSSVYYEDDLEISLGYSSGESSLYTLMDDSTHYALLNRNQKTTKRFF